MPLRESIWLVTGLLGMLKIGSFSLYSEFISTSSCWSPYSSYERDELRIRKCSREPSMLSCQLQWIGLTYCPRLMGSGERHSILLKWERDIKDWWKSERVARPEPSFRSFFSQKSITLAVSIFLATWIVIKGDYGSCKEWGSWYSRQMDLICKYLSL